MPTSRQGMAPGVGGSQRGAAARRRSVDFEAPAGHYSDARLRQPLLKLGMAATAGRAGAWAQTTLRGQPASKSRPPQAMPQARGAPHASPAHLMPLCSHTQSGRRARMSARCCIAGGGGHGQAVGRREGAAQPAAAQGGSTGTAPAAQTAHVVGGGAPA